MTAFDDDDRSIDSAHLLVVGYYGWIAATRASFGIDPVTGQITVSASCEI